ncbi:MAG: competence protein ComFB [Spirochaetaceae bacterium]|nr:MAG: competence protein ComFB [Spirochaetaceae bacterium]
MLEEIVLERIDEILHDFREKNPSEALAVAEEFRLDVACYVLNRIDAVYVVSGRGLAYMDIDYLEKLQRDADLITLIHQGIKRVLTIQRPYYTQKRETPETREGLFFNLPIIRGRIFNSLNFAPVFEIDVKLLHQNENVTMIEPNWQNPYTIVENTAGNYYFWPKPVTAEKTGVLKSFEFEIVIESGQFEKLNHFFSIPVTSESGMLDYFRINKILNLKDIYLVPRE